MTHPEELLAGYVDGTLRDDERAGVDAHLETCELCREEVELARGAVAALATLEELPVPLGVTGPVLSEARRPAERPHRAGWQRLQWAGGLAAAAAIVAVIAVSLGQGSDPPSGADAAGAGQATGAAAPEFEAGETLVAVQLEVQDANYTRDALQVLAQGSVARSDALEPSPGAEEDGPATTLVAAGPARRCLTTGGAPLGDPDHQLVRLIQAEYQHTPAYIGLFSKSPGAGQPADRTVVWVVAIDDCRFLGGAQA